MSDRVSIAIEDGIADVRLSRPEKMNALDPAMFVGLTEAGKQLADDTGLRAVVLSGEGKAFCAGLDFMSFQQMASDNGGEKQQRESPRLLENAGSPHTTFAQYAAWVWNQLPVPVIGAVHGVAFGGGMQLALATDIRFAAPDTRFSLMEIKWGLVPDMTGTQTLRNLVPLDVAKELAFTGRIISGNEAGKLGLVTHVTDDPRAGAFELAREIAGRSPSAVRAGKKLLHGAWNGSTEDGLHLEAEMQRSVIGGPNQVEAVRANVEKRAPKFHDPE